MDCNHAKELLSVYVFEEIEDADRGRLESHLQVCGQCTRALEKFRVVRQALSDMPDPEVPADFLVGVRARLEQPVTWMDTVDDALATLSGRRLMTGASLALAAGFAVLVGNTGGDLAAPPVRAARQERDAVAEAPRDVLAGAALASESEEQTAGAAEGGEASEKSDQARDKKKEFAPVVAPSAPGGSALAADAAPAPQAEVVAVAPAPAPAASARRPSAAESFDDVFGEAEPEAAAAPPPAPAAPVAMPAAAPKRAAAQPPSSPFLERKALASRTEAEAPRELASMGANELGQELARLEEARGRSRRRSARGAGTSGASASGRADLSIFAPAASVARGADALVEDLGGLGGYADDEADLGGADAFLGDAGTGLARVSDGDAFDRRGGPAPAADELFSDAPRVAPVTIAFLRTTFGRSVSVLQPTQVSRFPAQVGRDLGLRSSDPRGALMGIHSLVESGLGLRLEGVEIRQGEEVALLLSFAPGESGQRALERFVEDLRGLGGTALASDIASAGGGELGRLARVTLPTP